MTDKELLELAAKAYGYPISDGYFEPNEKTGEGWWVYIDGSGEPPNDSAWTELWNPIINDGDALRLAVKLRMVVSLANCCCCAVVDWYENDDDKNEVMVRFSDEFDDKECDTPEEATRIAIVRAAAEIGRKME